MFEDIIRNKKESDEEVKSFEVAPVDGRDITQAPPVDLDDGGGGSNDEEEIDFDGLGISEEELLKILKNIVDKGFGHDAWEDLTSSVAIGSSFLIPGTED